MCSATWVASTAAAGDDEGGEDEPDEFEHRGRIADPMSLQDRRTSFLALQPYEDSLIQPIIESAL